MTTPIMTTPMNDTSTTTRSRRVRIMAALLGVGALAATIACGTQAAPPPLAPPLAPAQQPGQQPAQQLSAGALSVNCGAGQQAIIRPSTVNGQPVSQVDCVPTVPMAASQPAWGPPQPIQPAAPTSYYPPAPVAAAPAMAEPVSYRPARVVTNDYVEYQPRVIQHRTWKPRRSVQKSAVIIGSSAGIGAAIGGAIHGGKGALIGAALGGGGAALWDQATRR